MSDTALRLYLPNLPAEQIPSSCAVWGHPGSTYNPLLDMTWCTCGSITTKGDQIDMRLTRGLGPLSKWRPIALLAEEAEWGQTPQESPAITEPPPNYPGGYEHDLFGGQAP